MRLVFDEFVLDTGTRELYRDGRALSLTPKAFELLTILVRNRPSVVSKSVLQDQLWADRFVVDKNLSNLISEIREALGEDASRPRFIRTAHRVGYAFRHSVNKNGLRDRRGLDNGRLFRLIWSNQRITLDEGDHVLGRDPDADVYLDSPSVSRRHAIIRIAEGEATLEDLGSRNGTFVGKRRADGVITLNDGDAIRLGSVVLTLRVVLAPGSTKSAVSTNANEEHQA
jgi:DNA-binding winged helix-turn-helix (wHTH) protein